MKVILIADDASLVTEVIDIFREVRTKQGKKCTLYLASSDASVQEILEQLDLGEDKAHIRALRFDN